MAKNAFLTQLGKRTATRTAVKNQDGNVQLVSGKAILEIPLERISEDPTQPRTTDNDGFSEEAISGLADTIVANGLLQPISVHADPNKPGFYIINHGARRFRASKKAGLPTIAAIVDEDYSQQKQLIENLHHDRIQFGRPHLRRGTGSPLAGHHLGAAPLVESISPISQLSGYDGRNGWVQIHDPLALVQEDLPLAAAVYCLTFVGTVPAFIFGIL